MSSAAPEFVAAGAGDGEPHEHRGGGIGDVVQDFLAALHQITRVAFVGIMAVKRGGDACVRVVGLQFIASDLFLEEAVVRFVVVERLDDVVAVAPGIRPDFVGLESFALGVAGKVEPVTGPAFAVTSGGEQAVHDLVERFGRVVGEESVHFFRRRWQANQIEGRAADQGDLVRGRCGPQSFRFQFGEHKSVD